MRPNQTSSKFFLFLFHLACSTDFESFQGDAVVKNPSANAGEAEVGSIPELGMSPGGGNGNPLQYSCLENPMDRGAWKTIVQKAAKSQMRLSTSLLKKKKEGLKSKIKKKRA